jgi:hypothetical protein
MRVIYLLRIQVMEQATKQKAKGVLELFTWTLES